MSELFIELLSEEIPYWLQKNIVEQFKNKGVKGVKYADAFTRHKSPDKRSMNYVVFDDKIIDIAKKYGISLTMASAVAAGTMTPQEAQAGFLPASQRGSADPRALAATGLLGAAAAPTLATPESKGKDPLRVPAGLLDAAANMGAAIVAPYANMPHTLIQALTSDRPTKDIKKARDARAAAMDYQLRTKLGKTISDEGLRYLAEAIAPAMAAGVAITEPIQEFYGLLPPRVRLVGETLLDAF